MFSFVSCTSVLAHSILWINLNMFLRIWALILNCLFPSKAIFSCFLAFNYLICATTFLFIYFFWLIAVDRFKQYKFIYGWFGVRHCVHWCYVSAILRKHIFWPDWLYVILKLWCQLSLISYYELRTTTDEFNVIPRMWLVTIFIHQGMTKYHQIALWGKSCSRVKEHTQNKPSCLNATVSQFTIQSCNRGSSVGSESKSELGTLLRTWSLFWTWLLILKFRGWTVFHKSRRKAFLFVWSAQQLQIGEFWIFLWIQWMLS